MSKWFKYGCLMVLAMLFICSVNADAFSVGDQGKRYKIKSGIVKYTISGANQSGTEELYFANWGAQEARYSDMSVEVFGFKQQQNSVNYIDGDWAYSYDPKTNQATKINYKELMHAMQNNPQTRNKFDFGEETIKSMGGVKVGSESILGRNCDIWEVSNFGTKTWVWNGIPLKSEVNFMGMSMNITATDFQPNARVQEAKLILPASAVVVDQTQMATQQMENVDMQQAQEAMGQMNEMMNTYKNSPEYQQQMQAMQQAQQQWQQQNTQAVQNSAEESFAEKTVVSAQQGVENATQQTVTEATTQGTKKVLGSLFKKMF